MKSLKRPMMLFLAMLAIFGVVLVVASIQSGSMSGVAEGLAVGIACALLYGNTSRP